MTELNNISGALILMGIGMCTVFVILIIVIQTSRALIAIVNRVAPDEKPTTKKVTTTATQTITSDVMAVIDAAVKKVTNGEGHVGKVAKL